ncbi:histidine--tRNA ligase [bacterium]|nr:MAG: histidine--tRNA ligase [bacterium]
MTNKTKAKKNSKSAKTVVFERANGMNDVSPRSQEWRRLIWQTGQTVSELHDFYFIETPVLEPAELFESGVGPSDEELEKQLYISKTKEGERLALRFNSYAPILRSYLEHRLVYFASPLKVFHTGPYFRHLEIKPGFDRQFHVWGFEVVGEADSIYDGEIILAIFDFLKALKLKNLILKINTSGCRVCRPAFKQKLKNYYRSHKEELCRKCEKNIDVNPFALVACEEEKCRLLREKSPIILDYLCQNCNNHLKAVLELVEDNGIGYEPNPYLLAENDYANRTIFEIFAPPFELPVASGSRYDYLAEVIGGRITPAVGGTLGFERVIEAMKRQDIVPHAKSKPKVFFVVIGDQAKKSALRLMNQLRSSGVAVVEVVGKKTLKAQLKIAERMNISLALLLGQKEVFEGTVIVRDMISGVQETVLSEKIVEEVKKRLH